MIYEIPIVKYLKSFFLASGSTNTPLPATPSRDNTATYCLSKLPGKRLDLSALLASKKFRGRGNKEGALAAFRALERAGLGKLITTCATRGASSVRAYCTYIPITCTRTSHGACT